MRWLQRACILVVPLCAAILPAAAVGAATLPAFVPREYLNDEQFLLNQAAQPPAIDGDLADACWNAALELYPFSTLGGGGSLSVLQTRVKVAWDKEGFYVAYRCEQPDMLLAERRGDHLEIFFMPLYPNQPPHVNHATSLTAMAHEKPAEFHYQQAWGRMGGAGGIYFSKKTGVQSAGKIGDDWWTWEAKIPFADLWVRGMPPPDASLTFWKIGFNRLSNHHGEIGWYASLLSSLNHQVNHCPVFRLVGAGTAPAVRLSHPLAGEPGAFSVRVRHVGGGEGSYRVKVLTRGEPFDPEVHEAPPSAPATGKVALKSGQETTLEYRVATEGWRNQYRVEVWDVGEKTLFFRSIWYSLGEPLTWGWDRERAQLGILPEPQEVSMGRGSFPLSREIDVVVAPGHEPDRFAAGLLARSIGSRKAKWPAFAVREADGRRLPARSLVVLGAATDSLLLRAFASERRVGIPWERLRPQGYFLAVTSRFVLIAGGDEAGTFYGVQTLRQLVLNHPKGIPALTILDWPDLDWRGAFHTFEVTEQNIDLACLCKLNVGGLSLAQKKRYHFEPRMFTAHTWFGHTGGALVPPEKRERVGGEAVICPASECRDELVARIDQSLRKLGIDSAEMRHVFVGGDEAPFGLDPPCQKMIDEKGAGWTVAHHFRDNMLAACRARDRTMICWADALLNAEDSLNYIPRDFHPVHWLYYPSTYFGGCDVLGKHGLPFIVAPMTRGEQSLRFPQIRSREGNIPTLARCAAHAGGKGVWLTTWGGGLDDDLLWYSYLLAAEYGWSAGPDLASFRTKFGRLVYGSEHGAEWLLDLERITSLHLARSEKPIPPEVVQADRKRLDAIEDEIREVLARDWYLEPKFHALLKVIAEVRTKLPAR